MSKVWFITGATRGLGKHIALGALAAGEMVIATGRDVDELAAALAQVEVGDRLQVAAVDVRNKNQIEAAVEGAIERFGRIDVLVNNAGFGQLGAFETIPADVIEAQFATNVFGLFEVTRAVLPHMREQRAGHILNMSSIGGVVGFGGAAAYHATKFAIEGFSEDLAIDIQPFGIRLTIVEPGFFRTDFLEGSSVRYGSIDIADYEAAAVAQREKYGSYSRKQPGDPRKLAAALLKVVNSDEPPLRLAAGTDSVRMSRDALESRLAVLEQWRTLSESTDHD